MSGDDLKILESLAQIELAVSELYAIYARKYPEHRDFWGELVREEKNHAELIRGLKAFIKNGTVRFDHKRCAASAVETVFNLINERIEAARSRVTPLANALNSALQIEKNVIEKDFCSFFEGDNEEFRDKCATVTRETSQHRDKLIKMLDQIRG